MAIPENDGKQVIEVMCNPSYQPPQRLHFLRLTKLLLGLTQGLLDAGPFRHVIAGIEQEYAIALCDVEKMDIGENVLGCFDFAQNGNRSVDRQETFEKTGLFQCGLALAQIAEAVVDKVTSRRDHSHLGISDQKCR